MRAVREQGKMARKKQRWTAGEAPLDQPIFAMHGIVSGKGLAVCDVPDGALCCKSLVSLGFHASASLLPDQVQGLDRAGENHGGIDETAFDVEVEAIGHQRHANHHQEGKGQHLG